MERDSVNTNGATAVSNPIAAQPSQSQPASQQHQQLQDLQQLRCRQSQQRSGDSASPSSYGYPRASQQSSSTRTSPIGPPTNHNTTATTNPTAPAPAPTTTAPMAASILHPPQSLPPAQSAYAPYGYYSARSSDRDAPSRTGPPSDVSRATLHIHGLPNNANEQYVRVLCTFTEQNLIHIELTAPQEGSGTSRSAVLHLTSPQAAWDVKNTLHGKNGLIVDSPTSIGHTSGSSSSGPSSTTSPDVGTSQSSRFEAAFAPLPRTSPPNGEDHVRNGVLHYGESTYGRMNSFSPLSQTANPFNERQRVTSVALINEATDDDDTGDIINNPVAYAENGSYSTQRRATAPHISLSAQMAGLSLNTGANGISTAQRGQSVMYPPPPAYSNTRSPTALNGNIGYMQPTFLTVNGRTQLRAPPPANPADHNPPCNTLYVGNLPMDASEDELRRLFASQRGYRRMCFRTKPNGPMCFVEFDDITCATKALKDLYGFTLSNSKKGGIRLSFSKNPLGVRATPQPGQGPAGSLAGVNGMPTHTTNGSGVNPPPGLRMPPGLGASRSASSYSSSTMPNGGSMTSGNISYVPSTSNGSNALPLANVSPFGRDPWAQAGHYFSTILPTNGATSLSNGSTSGSTPYPNGAGPFPPSSGATNGSNLYASSNGASNGSSPYPPSNGAINGSGAYASSSAAANTFDPFASVSNSYPRFARGQF